MRLPLRYAAILGGIALTMAIAVACDGSSADSSEHEGAASLATAQFWAQEASGDLLPEGVGVTALGVETNGVRSLEVSDEQEDDGVDARVCVPFRYRQAESPFGVRTRVYIATLRDGAWHVEPVKDDGTCDDVV
jgi:hypothetical protein